MRVGLSFALEFKIKFQADLSTSQAMTTDYS